ncbi:hypothetical protein CLUG_02029 [Clavispora lusitaniae ATCC 42720]|uniref:Uncharacterized protein n=1 Tax=Clavispora lusitaniae (strain ATCC 42720) TaxID=306902 RepID=C4Y1E7_CLAL4|nr:uncharacterized protein CLUG_02029 [Clavispora lusitaniae ATCC 42720]EEQ37907.1 hypothetical protein CLUG_02029 [Clavispora lusitaniae ATCC 42720]
MEGYVFHGPADSFLARERRLARRRRARAVGAGARPGANARDLAHFAPVARKGRLLAFFGRNQPPFARAERRDFCVHGTEAGSGKKGRGKHDQAKRAGAETNRRKGQGRKRTANRAGEADRQDRQARQGRQASGSGCSDGPVTRCKDDFGARPCTTSRRKQKREDKKKKTRKGQESQALENPHMSNFKSRKIGTWNRVTKPSIM